MLRTPLLSLVLCLLFACPVIAQVQHTFPALDTNNTFTGINSFPLGSYIGSVGPITGFGAGNVPCASLDSAGQVDALCAKITNPYTFLATGGSASYHGWNFYFQTDMKQPNNPYGLQVNATYEVPASGQVATDMWARGSIMTVAGGNSTAAGTILRADRIRNLITGNTTVNGGMGGITWYLPLIDTGSTLNGDMSGFNCDNPTINGTITGNVVCAQGGGNQTQVVFLAFNGHKAGGASFGVSSTDINSYCWGTGGTSNVLYAPSNCLHSGTGSPNGVVTDSPGGGYFDRNGFLWIKGSGVGTNTGWVQLGSAGVTGSGSTGFLPEWSSSTGLGNSPIQDVTGANPYLIDNSGTYALRFPFGSFGNSSAALPLTGNAAVSIKHQTNDNTNCIAATCYGLFAPLTYVLSTNNPTGRSTAIAGTQKDTGSTASTIGILDGGYFDVQNDVAATVTRMSAIEAIAGSGATSSTGVITAQNAGYFSSVARDNAVTSNSALYAFTTANLIGTGTATNDRTVYIDSPVFSLGTFTHHYGLYMADQTTGGGSNPDPWGIFEAGTAKNQLGGALAVTNTVQTTAVAFSSLPSCTGGTEGSMRAVTDSTTNTWGATITGSSTNHVLAYCNGTNWTVMAK